MKFAERVILGLFIILVGVASLWYGSPARTGASEPIPAFAYTFVFLFAIGFIIGAMGLMGAEHDYPALLSGLVLYFVVGALVAVFMAVGGSTLDGYTLEDAGEPTFWIRWIRVAAIWPLELVRRAGVFGYYYSG